MARNYTDWSKDELVRELKKLEKRKKYGLVWEDKPEEVALLCKEKLPILEEDTNKEIVTDKEKPNHILIEGDNYHALSVLNYTHKNAIDVIYIDPPYNTGAKDWKYNNDYVDINDRWRHSKWISMMYKRLRLARNLLKQTGLIMVAIDDHEVHNVRHLLDEIMGEENYIATICIEVNPAGQNIRQNTPAISHDYCILYAKAIDKTELIPRTLSEEEMSVFKEKDKNGQYIWDNLRRRGGNSTPADRPGQWFPLYADFTSKKIGLTKFKDSVELWPIDPKGIKRIWRVNPAGFEREYHEGNISIVKKKDRLEIIKKSYAPIGRKPKTIWKEARHSATSHGTKLLIDLLGKNIFNYPKSLHLVEDCLRYYAKPNATVLDFFAGSGTTGHAVLTLNKADDGKRRFILCTNNENSICTEVCYPRIKKVIHTLENDSKSKLVKNAPGNLKYFKTDFVDAEPTDKNKKKMVDKSTEMLCLKEDCFDEIKHGREFRIFTNSQGKLLGIVYDDDGIEPFKKELKKINNKFVVYVFSLDESAREEEFEDVRNLVDLKPIPAVILNVYKRIFK